MLSLRHALTQPNEQASGKQQRDLIGARVFFAKNEGEVKCAGWNGHFLGRQAVIQPVSRHKPLAVTQSLRIHQQHNTETDSMYNQPVGWINATYSK